MVSGCYDLLHGGHVVFFETASQFGDLYVSVGADRNIEMLKHHRPRFNENERVYIVQSIRFVHEAFVGSGTGMLDFEPDLRRVKPDFFVVNEDGHTDDKKKLCESLGVKYVVLPRTPKAGLPARSSSALKAEIAADAKKV
jgi:cytidyltransferase-like protein